MKTFASLEQFSSNVVQIQASVTISTVISSNSGIILGPDNHKCLWEHFLIFLYIQNVVFLGIAEFGICSTRPFSL